MGKRASSIELSNEEREYLKLQTRARTIQAQTVTRARILLLRADSVSMNSSLNPPFEMGYQAKPKRCLEY